eukprot:4703627-Pyramimonas_sp.AAC.1
MSKHYVDVKGYCVDVKGYCVDVKGYDADVKGYCGTLSRRLQDGGPPRRLGLTNRRYIRRLES